MIDRDRQLFAKEIREKLIVCDDLVDGVVQPVDCRKRGHVRVKAKDAGATRDLFWEAVQKRKGALIAGDHEGALGAREIPALACRRDGALGITPRYAQRSDPQIAA